MKKAIVFGSLNMDLTIQCDRIPDQGETISGSNFLVNVGGKGCNQAVSAAKSNCAVNFIGAVGSDAFGTQIINTMQQYNIDTSSVQIRNDESTGVAVILRCEGDNRIVLDAGANASLDIQEAEKQLERIAQAGDIFFTQFENKIQDVKSMLKKAKGLGLFTVLNPAPAQFIEPEFYQYIDLLIVNQSEAKTLTGIYPDDDISSANVFSAIQGGTKCIITLGSAGSITSGREGIHRLQAYKVEPVDTTAAGDAYIGALISKMAQGIELTECMDYASKVSALTITKVGAQQSIPRIDEVEEFFKGGKN